MAFSNRWRIEGTLTTRSPAHIGSGDPTERDGLCDRSDPRNVRKIQVSAVVTDYDERAYLPGSAIKGNLRSWARTHIRDRASSSNVQEEVFDAVFGSDDSRKVQAVGGKVEFLNAFAGEATPPSLPPPYWSPERLTGVAASVAIDRRRRTAVEKKLFYHEFVPAGISFKTCCTAQDLSLDELQLLLVALEGFNEPRDAATGDPVTVGASTGDGYGRFQWRLDSISRLEKGPDVEAWLSSADVGAGYARGLQPLSAEEQQEITKKAREKYGVVQRALLSIDLTLQFEGPFLVNDPSRCPKDSDESRQREGEDESGTPDHLPRLDADGFAYLPSSSMRGSVRSQAERIIRTLKPEGACLSTSASRSCPAVYDMGEVEKLCLACRVFGAAGWRSPVEFSDFRETEKPQKKLRQEMVAIDRFTGGAARTAKFNIEAVQRPVLTGTMTIDLERMPAWGLGLMALVVRDLVEGDVTSGLGANKGYGAFRARIDRVRIAGCEGVSRDLRAILDQNGFNADSLNNLDATARPSEEIQCTLMDLLEAFHQRVETFGSNTPARGGHDGRVL